MRGADGRERERERGRERGPDGRERERGREGEIEVEREGERGRRKGETDWKTTPQSPICQLRFHRAGVRPVCFPPEASIVLMAVSIA